MESLDLLYTVLAVSIGLLTIFLLWMIYYLVRILRNAVYVVEKFTKVLQKADEVLDLAKEKIHSTGTYLGVAVNIAKGIMDHFGDAAVPAIKKAAKKTKKRARKKK